MVNYNVHTHLNPNNLKAKTLSCKWIHNYLIYRKHHPKHSDLNTKRWYHSLFGFMVWGWCLGMCDHHIFPNFVANNTLLKTIFWGVLWVKYGIHLLPMEPLLLLQIFKKLDPKTKLGFAHFPFIWTLNSTLAKGFHSVPGQNFSKISFWA